MIFQPPQNFKIPLSKYLNKSYSKTGRMSQANTSRHDMLRSLDKQKSYIRKNFEPQPLFQKQRKILHKRNLSSVLNKSTKNFSSSHRITITSNKSQYQYQLKNDKLSKHQSSLSKNMATKIINLLKRELKSQENQEQNKKQLFYRYKTSRQFKKAEEQSSKDLNTLKKLQLSQEDLSSTNITYLSIQNLRKSKKQNYMRVSKRPKNKSLNHSINVSSNLLSFSKRNQNLKTTQNEQEEDQTSINICISQKSIKNSENGQIQQDKKDMESLSKQLKQSNIYKTKNTNKDNIKRVIIRNMVRFDKKKFGNISLFNNPSMTIKSLRQNFVCR